jgi:xanthine dehydrogenase accessory factor
MNETAIFKELFRRLESREHAVLATIVDSEGPTPQVPGASALFGRAGLLKGTLGGGMLEADAEEKAALCLKTGDSLLYRFDLQGEDAAAETPICGGFVWVLVDGSPEKSGETWRSLTAALQARRSGLLATRILRSDDGRAEVERAWLDKDTPALDSASSFSRFSKELAQAGRQGKPVVLQEQGPLPGGGRVVYFLQPLAPPPQLLIVGAGHIGQALARQAVWLDFEVTVIDDRADFACPERFQDGAALIVDDTEKAVCGFPISSDTYIVIVTRGHSQDAEALRASIRSPAAYVGMIGSRHKVALMRDRFLEEGWASAREWDRVHTPIGLKIGSKTVEEIAVSIAAELIEVRSRVRKARAGEGL